MSFAAILEDERIRQISKLIAKVPRWESEAGSLELPSTLNVEQCSSEETAMYKAALAVSLCGGVPSIADLTGGLGVDSWAFSQKAVKVLYNERDCRLAAAVRHNFGILGAGNVSFSSFDIKPDDSGWAEKLRTFNPRLTYLDPARRDLCGHKVFLLEDCSPDILPIMPELLSISRFVMVKLSPMMDISHLVGLLGRQCREIHIVCSRGEVRELLAIMDRENDGGCRIVLAENGNRLEFAPADESNTSAKLPDRPEDLSSSVYLFEPSAGLMKAGLFKYPCRYGLVKAGISTHLYFCDKPREELVPFGRYYGIERVAPMSRQSLKETGKAFAHAWTSARNLKCSSDELRGRMGIKPGDNPEGIHIFGFTADFTDGTDGRFLAVCRRRITV